MNEKVKEFLDAEQKKHEKEKQETLIELGIYEKVYSPYNNYSEEYSLTEWDRDSSTVRYFKKVPVEITDEEYQQVIEYANKEATAQTNPVATALTVIAWIVFIAELIAGIVLGNVEVIKGSYHTYIDTEFSFAAAFTYWCDAFINGTMFLGFAEIIKLLDAIKKKK